MRPVGDSVERTSSVQRSSPAARSVWPSRLTLGLGGLVLLGLLLSLVADPGPQRAKSHNSLRYAQEFLAGDLGRRDSWRPMRYALNHVETAGADQLYEQVFFGDKIKFQYPPTALVLLSGIDRMAGERVSSAQLNMMSWGAVMLVVILSPCIWWLVLDRRACAPRPVDWVGQTVLLIAASGLFYPIFFAYHIGQIQTWLDLLAVGLVLSFVSGRRGLSGALAGLFCVIKPTLAFLLVWALFRRHWRFAVGFSAVAGAIGVISLISLGLDVHLGYVDVVSFIGRRGESYHPNQSMNGLLHRLLSNGPNAAFDPHAFAPYDARVHFATVASSGVLIAAVLLWRRREACRAPVADLLIVVLTLTIASPIAWEHHYGVTLPLFAVALPLALRGHTFGRTQSFVFLLLLAVSWLLISTNFPDAVELADTPWNFLQSTVYFGGLLLLGLLYWLRRAVAVKAEGPTRSAPPDRGTATTEGVA